MRRWSATIAVLTVLVLAGVCWSSGLSPLSCTIRAVIGAAVMYVVVRVLGRLALGILVDAAMEQSANNRAGISTSERRDDSKRL